MLHSLYSLSRVNPGFATDRIVTAEVSLDATACNETGRCQAFFDTLLDRLHGIAGTEGVALTDTLPLNGRDGSFVYDAEGHPRDPRHARHFSERDARVTPGYFATLGMNLVRGRLLDDQDASGTSRAVVINQRMADRLWPHQDPLGRHIENVHDEANPGVWSANDRSRCSRRGQRHARRQPVERI